MNGEEFKYILKELGIHAALIALLKILNILNINTKDFTYNLQINPFYLTNAFFAYIVRMGKFFVLFKFSSTKGAS